MAFFFIMRAIAYVDGFNLFYGSLKKSPYKWLNLEALIKNISPEYYSILSIKYFTARISPLSEDKSRFKTLKKVDFMGIFLNSSESSQVVGTVQ